MSPHFPTPSARPQFAKPAMCNFLEAASLLAPDRSGPSPEFLESFVYGMLGTLITGCLCISAIGPLFPLEECKLLSLRMSWLLSPNPNASQYLSGVSLIFTSQDSHLQICLSSLLSVQGQGPGLTQPHTPTTWQSPRHREAS